MGKPVSLWIAIGVVGAAQVRAAVPPPPPPAPNPYPITLVMGPTNPANGLVKADGGCRVAVAVTSVTTTAGKTPISNYTLQWEPIVEKVGDNTYPIPITVEKSAGGVFLSANLSQGRKVKVSFYVTAMMGRRLLTSNRVTKSFSFAVGMWDQEVENSGSIAGTATRNPDNPTSDATFTLPNGTFTEEAKYVLTGLDSGITGGANARGNPDLETVSRSSSASGSGDVTYTFTWKPNPAFPNPIGSPPGEKFLAVCTATAGASGHIALGSPAGTVVSSKGAGSAGAADLSFSFPDKPGSGTKQDPEVADAATAGIEAKGSISLTRQFSASGSAQVTIPPFRSGMAMYPNVIANPTLAGGGGSGSVSILYDHVHVNPRPKPSMVRLGVVRR